MLTSPHGPDDLAAVDGEANLGLGCGNPEAVAALAPGETVVDLGAGAGFDRFLAAREVGPSGRVVGVDVTPEMVEAARANAAANALDNVEFRLGEIEHLPVADATADVVATAEIPADLHSDAAGCVAGAATVESLERALGAAGFEAVAVAPRDDGARIVDAWDDRRSLGEFLAGGRITSRKPAAGAER